MCCEIVRVLQLLVSDQIRSLQEEARRVLQRGTICSSVARRRVRARTGGHIVTGASVLTGRCGRLGAGGGAHPAVVTRELAGEVAGRGAGEGAQPLATVGAVPGTELGVALVAPPAGALTAWWRRGQGGSQDLTSVSGEVSALQIQREESRPASLGLPEMAAVVHILCENSNVQDFVRPERARIKHASVEIARLRRAVDSGAACSTVHALHSNSGYALHCKPCVMKWKRRRRLRSALKARRVSKAGAWHAPADTAEGPRLRNLHELDAVSKPPIQSSITVQYFDILE